MFRRKWSALPADPVFPSDLKKLGYFINKDDEIRSIENEDNYFNYFISRNSRVCDRQRFAMNQAIQNEIHKRLVGLGLNKVFLPVGTSEPSQPNVPIFVSADIAKKSRVVIIFGETHQDLGVLAHRILGSRGGIYQGSLVAAVNLLLEQRCSHTDPSPPGIILANMGELLWWPEGGRSLSKFAFDWAPMLSACHLGNYIDPRVNHVPGNENPAAHVKHIFEDVVPAFVDAAAKLDVIGLGDGADVVESYLNCDATWERVGGRLGCFTSVGGQFPVWDIKCDGLREFVRDRARGYVPSPEPLGMALSGPAGNPHTTTFTSLGCPVFSAGEAYHVETLFIASHPMVLYWLQEVADTPGVYKNPSFTIVFSDGPDQNNLWSDWNGEDNRATEDVKSNKDDTASPPKLCIVPGDGVEKDGSGRGEEKNEQTQYVVRTKPDNGDGNGPEESKA